MLGLSEFSKVKTIAQKRERAITVKEIRDSEEKISPV
jgi:hypothetical protein